MRLTTSMHGADAASTSGRASEDSRRLYHENCSQRLLFSSLQLLQLSSRKRRALEVSRQSGNRFLGDEKCVRPKRAPQAALKVHSLPVRHGYEHSGTDVKGIEDKRERRHNRNEPQLHISTLSASSMSASSCASSRPVQSSPKYITAALIRVTSLSEMEYTLNLYSQDLNARHVAIALWRLPKAVENSRSIAANQRVLKSTQSSAHNDAHGAFSRRSNAAQRQMLSSSDDFDEMTARAQRLQILSLAERLSSQFLQHLPEYGPKDLSQAVWSLGHLGHSPGEVWLTAVLQACKHRLPSFDGCQISNLLWGIAVLHASPGHAWMEAATQHVLSLLHVRGAFTPQGASVCFWAAASIRSKSVVSGHNNPSSSQQPAGCSPVTDRDWVGLYLGALTPSHLKDCDPHHVSMILCGLAKLKYQPPLETMQALLEGCLLGSAVKQLSSGSGADTVDDCIRTEGTFGEGPGLVAGSRREQFNGPSQDTGVARGSVIVRGQGLGPQGISNVLWALAVLSYRPPSSWLQTCMSEAMELFTQMRMQELAMTLWAVAELKLKVRRSWLDAYERASQSMLERERGLSPQSISLMLWSLAQLGHRPSTEWMSKATQASQNLMQHFTSHSLSNLGWSLATLQYQPSPAWFQSFSSRSTIVMQDATPQALSNIAWSVSKLTQHTAGPEWMMAILEASSIHLKRQNHAASKTLGELHGGGRRKKRSGSSAKEGDQDAAPGAQVMAENVYERHSSVDELSSDAMKHPGYTMGTQDGSVQDTWACLQIAAAGFSPQELCNLHWALSKIHYNMLLFDKSDNGPHSLCLKKGGDMEMLRKLRRAFHSWIGATEVVSCSLLSLYNAQNVSNLLVGSVRFLHLRTPDPALVTGAINQLNLLILKNPSAVRSQDAANTLWAVLKLGGHTSISHTNIQRLQQFTLQQLLPNCSTEELAQLAWSCAKLLCQSAAEANNDAVEALTVRPTASDHHHDQTLVEESLLSVDIPPTQRAQAIGPGDAIVAHASFEATTRRLLEAVVVASEPQLETMSLKTLVVLLSSVASATVGLGLEGPSNVWIDRAARASAAVAAQHLDLTSARQQLQHLDLTSAGQQLQHLDLTSAGQQLQHLDLTSAGQQLQHLDLTSARQQLQHLDLTSARQQLQHLDLTSARQQLQHQEKMLQRLLIALQQLGYLPSGEEGLNMWAVQVQQYSADLQQCSGLQAKYPKLLPALMLSASSGFDTMPGGRAGQVVSSALLQNLSAALWGLICYVQWKGGL
ncbi:hypothetical protein CEUSTIGMA_g5682.t1 [Chlamydomonas eustigma]|uniref:Uncharacterized protein n=1 Tax=Chlamydomonas eustigma TaxID=1157962 RepID=A0A250X643_9CHLO|nr:hypothetical protein CEUSTIGMA_g5682.t1 [Chlamydomonas eustigma]|eukprot:GAX78240.1 hypothetical protein CEUSTIGMA_g5682.t1 [Chlamydomonas eustigma]